MMRIIKTIVIALALARTLNHDDADATADAKTVSADVKVSNCSKTTDANAKIVDVRAEIVHAKIVDAHAEIVHADVKAANHLSEKRLGAMFRGRQHLKQLFRRSKRDVLALKSERSREEYLEMEEEVDTKDKIRVQKCYVERNRVEMETNAQFEISQVRTATCARPNDKSCAKIPYASEKNGSFTLSFFRQCSSKTSTTCTAINIPPLEKEEEWKDTDGFWRICYCRTNLCNGSTTKLKALQTVFTLCITLLSWSSNDQISVGLQMI